MRRLLAAASQWGACQAGDAMGGDGMHDSAVKLSCERGTLAARLSLDPATGRLTNFDFVPTRDQRCVP